MTPDDDRILAIAADFFNSLSRGLHATANDLDKVLSEEPPHGQENRPAE